MSIQQLHIEGFKSLKDVTWKPGALNVVIGPNGSGKSNLLLMLDLLRASAEGGLSQFMSSTEDSLDLLWDRQSSRALFEMVFNDSNVENTTRLKYLLSISNVIEPFVLSPLEEGLALVESKNDVEAELLMYLYAHRSLGNATLLDDQKAERSYDLIDILEKETVLSITKGLVDANNTTRAFRRYLSSWFIVNPIDTGKDAPIRRPFPVRYDQYVKSDGGNLLSVLHTLYSRNREFEVTIDTAMVAAFGGDYQKLIFPPASSQRIEMQVRWKSLKYEQSASGLSDGTLRFLYLIAVLANPNPPPLIAIDEPEMGLHPRMLPIIAEYAAEASKKTQVILTTHSPQFLDAFRDLKPTTTVATWEDGQTKLATLDGDELDYWLREYTLGSLFTSGELDNMAADIREKQMQAQA